MVVYPVPEVAIVKVLLIDVPFNDEVVVVAARLKVKIPPLVCCAG